MPTLSGSLETFSLAFDGGRDVTVYVPPKPPAGIVFAADGGWHTAGLAAQLEGASGLPTMIVGVHGLSDENERIKEYSPAFDPDRFAAHETFFVDDVRAEVRHRYDVAFASDRCAIWGASAGGELALALAIRHSDVYGASFCASPGGGYQPPDRLPAPASRFYLLGGTEEQWFLDNAIRWGDALRASGAEVVVTEREGAHGGAFWAEEFPLMVAWAFGRPA